MTSLAYLPRDVLIEIFSYFCPHCRGDLKPIKGVGTPHQQKRWREPQQPDQKSWYSIDKNILFSLATSCKTLHAAAEDILYHDFAPGYGDSELSELYTYGNRLNHVMSTVGRRKDLADKVRVLFVHPKHSNASVKRIVLALKQGADALGIDIAKAWRHRAEHFVKTWTRETTLGEDEYVFMLNSAFTDEILEYAVLRNGPPYDSMRSGTASQVARNFRLTANRFYRTLHHELIPMLIALLPKLSHIIYKHKSVFEEESVFDMFEHTALDALGVTELPYLRALEIDKDIFSILKRAPNLEQLDITKSSFPQRDQGSFGNRSKITTLRLQDTSSTSELSKALSFAAKDLRSLVVESSLRSSTPWVIPAGVIKHVRDYRHSLETLHLDFRDARVNSRSRSSDCTFQDFEKLQYVFLNTRLMFQIPPDLYSITQLLPPSLVSLHLAWNGLQLDPTERALQLRLAEESLDRSGNLHFAARALQVREVAESLIRQRELSLLERALLELANGKAERFQDLKHIGLDCWDKVDAAVHEAMLEAGIEFVPESWPVAYQK
ncbi:hypothetical protein FMEXI_2155 [Fusarium mexicanum]|uniref:Uncharacterized protein n=1 Tax=Fusarium mexicanum TaxID=751941 RepID=A0A8H5N6U9_9HYPO|nr:hypothetical protein FMEXI_2155 [Fusarium mexicanum]